MTADGATQLQIAGEEITDSSLADDVLSGLTGPAKELPPKHFYDARGSELFERICDLPEYYQTRSEQWILEQRGDEIISAAGSPTELVEIGSGSAHKARILLGAMQRGQAAEKYLPFDVCGPALEQAANELISEFAELSVHGVIGDFESDLGTIPSADGRRLVAILGGTIGNFAPERRRALLTSLAELLGREDHLIVGVDLVKDPAVIEAAYNDSLGVTAEFNRNVLRVINRELAADFDPNSFEHVAVFDSEREWIEMRLRANEQCTVSVEALDIEVEFAAGEEVRTEISAKFSRERIEADLAAAGMEPAGWFTDRDGLFAVVLARPSAT